MQEVNTTWAIAGMFWGVSLSAILGYFWMSIEMTTILWVLLFADFILGVTRARYFNRASVTSTNMYKGLTRKITRLALPFIMIGALKWAWVSNPESLSYAIVGIIIVSEGYSCLRHIYTINTGKDLPEIDAFELILQKVLPLFSDKLGKEIKPTAATEEKEEEKEKPSS